MGLPHICQSRYVAVFIYGVVVFIQALRFFFVCPLTEMTTKAGEINETLTLMTKLMFIELIIEKQKKIEALILYLKFK